MFNGLMTTKPQDLCDMTQPYVWDATLSFLIHEQIPKYNNWIRKISVLSTLQSKFYHVIRSKYVLHYIEYITNNDRKTTTGIISLVINKRSTKGNIPTTIKTEIEKEEFFLTIKVQ